MTSPEQKRGLYAFALNVEGELYIGGRAIELGQIHHYGQTIADLYIDSNSEAIRAIAADDYKQVTEVPGMQVRIFYIPLRGLIWIPEVGGNVHDTVVKTWNPSSENKFINVFKNRSPFKDP